MTVDPNDLVLGDDITPNDEELLNMTKRKRLASGWYGALSDNVSKKIADTGSLIIRWEWFPLEDVNDKATITTPTQSDSIILPIANPRHEGHTAPNTMGFAIQRFQALLGETEVPRHPYKDKSTGEWLFKGEIISEDEVDTCRVEVNKLVHGLCVAFWNGERSMEELVQRFAYILVGEPQGEKGYVNVKAYRPQLPDDATLIAPPFGVK